MMASLQQHCCSSLKAFKNGIAETSKLSLVNVTHNHQALLNDVLILLLILHISKSNTMMGIYYWHENNVPSTEHDPAYEIK